MNEQSIGEILEEVKNDICDNYCKYQEGAEYYDELVDEYCCNCPLNRL